MLSLLDSGSPQPGAHKKPLLLRRRSNTPSPLSPRMSNQEQTEVCPQAKPKRQFQSQDTS